MTQPLAVAGSHLALLREKASKHAIEGLLIGCAAVLLATAGTNYLQSGIVSPGGMLHAQLNNAALWIVDLLPFAFAIWGQYVSVVTAQQTRAAMVHQHTKLRTHTSILKKRARHDATHDALTGLPNRTLLQQRLARAINSNPGVRLALLMFDLVGFKEINESLGRTQGDQLLKRVAERLVNVAPLERAVARLGGDEFAFFTRPLESAEEAVLQASDLQRTLQNPFHLKGRELEVRASIGIGLYPDHCSEPDVLMQRAEAAMYAAKQKKSGVLVYEAGLDEGSPVRLTVSGELRQAIDRGELTLQYQPKVNLSTGRAESAEALVRWQHPRHGFISPEIFVPMAEQAGIIRILTRWVLDEALQQCFQWQRVGLRLGIAVNVSVQDLLGADFQKLVQGLLRVNKVPASELTLEITETSLMEDHKRVLDVLQRLADIGIRLAIDDFGKGYSSLTYLSELPVHELKIDRSFVYDMRRNPTHATIVRTTIDLAHKLGLKVIAEGVEDKETAMQLARLCCDAIQGFYASAPLFAEGLTDKWRELPAHREFSSGAA